jgi:predicted methyltransferase
MNASHQTAIRRAMSFEMRPVLERFAEEYRASLDDAQGLERELKRYLILRALHPRKRYGMAGRVDGLWHTFLLFTQLYARFCYRVAGRFLHHTPADIESREELRQFTKDYANLWKDYPRVFAEPPPESIWPSIEMICNGNSAQPGEDPAVAAALAKFEAQNREIFARRHQIVAACRLKPDMAVADVGACTGLFTRLLATAVGRSGKVYAVEISRPFIQHIKTTCRDQGIDNVVGVVCSPTSVALPPQSVDLVFLCATYSRLEFPFKTMKSIHRALRPGGQVVLIDFKRIPGVSKEWVLKNVRGNQEDFTHEILEGGFNLVEEKKFLRESYCLRFVKRSRASFLPSPGRGRRRLSRAAPWADSGKGGLPPGSRPRLRPAGPGRAAPAPGCCGPVRSSGQATPSPARRRPGARSARPHGCRFQYCRPTRKRRFSHGTAPRRTEEGHGAPPGEEEAFPDCQAGGAHRAGQ